jgi:eukaryotic-like serine/threonine-protein kinase
MPQTIVDNRYTRTRPLGSGGMADVYLAHDKVLDRDVALKVLKDQYAGNEEVVKLFRREARSAARLNHPNTVSVYDQGRSEDGTYYIAMEYLPGGTLKDRVLGEGALDPDAATKFASQIAQALGHAHEHGVIHRDIKSRNILLTEMGHAKVADFGIARAATATTTGSRSGLVLGTPSYISPEQATGKPVGPRSDLYSLGVVLYEMLTGTLPYGGEDPTSMAFQHVHGPLRSPREAEPDIPEPLNALTTKLLAKDPEDRYASAVELADNLKRVRSGLSPLSVATEMTTAEMTAAPLLSTGEKGPKKMAIHTSATSPMNVFKSGRRVRGRLLRTLGMALCGVLLLGGLTWALTQGPINAEPSGSEEASSSEEAPAPEARGYADDVGLEIGSRNEASDEAVASGYAIEQDPGAGTTVEEGAAEDVAVSTGPEQVPAATQAAPTNVGAAGSQGVLAAPPAASKAVDPKQDPAAVQEAPSSVGAGSVQQAPTSQAALATIETASGPPVTDKTEQKGKK